jgi:signal transduction histidine kinase
LLASLIINGLDAITGEGTIDVITELSVDRKRVRVLVRDTGVGVSAADMRAIMRPFYTTKARGLGLGLPLAKRVIERLGGTFDIRSVKGEGTVVELTLPAVA